MNNEKEQFIENIQKWVKLDSQMKAVNEKLRKARELKHKLLDNIVQYVELNKLESTKIEISDGELRFYEKIEYQPITFTYIEESLGKLLADKKQVECIMNYLRENREITVSTDIRRKSRSASFSEGM
jgi:hypothetical protein